MIFFFAFSNTEAMPSRLRECVPSQLNLWPSCFMKLHISLAPGFLSFPIPAGRKETIDFSKVANVASAHAPLAKHLSHGCTEGKS